MLRIGFIGCGGIARQHATHLSKMRSVQIVAASDLLVETAAKFSNDFDVPYHHKDYRKILEINEIDAVWVCTPTYQHAKPVVHAASSGKHIFCEKPMALKISDAKKMHTICEKSGIKFTVGFVRRFDPMWGKFKQIIQSDALGFPVIWRFAAGGKPPHQWFRDIHKGGGPLIDGAIHNYDFALKVFGEVASVQSSTLTLDKTSVGPDTGSAILNFKNGNQHTLIWSWGVASGSSVVNLNDFIGPKGTLQFGDTRSKKLKPFAPKTHGAFTLKGEGGKEKLFTYRKKDMFLEQAKHVVQCFSNNEQPIVKATDGIAALRIAEAVLRSGRTKRTINL